MRIIVTVYPEGEDIESPIKWARALGFEVDDSCSSDHGRCITIKGDISATELSGTMRLLRNDGAVPGTP
jgi:hypothetical protein